MADPGFDIEICEVIYDPPGEEPDDEKITLCNRGSNDVIIGGWRLSDDEGSYTIPSGTKIISGGEWSVFGSTYNPTGYTKGLFLANSKDSVTLFNLEGNVVDTYSW
jgi:hypothetical protein